MNSQLPPGEFYGQLLKNQSVAGFSFSLMSYAPSSRLPRHSHESSYFCLVLSGSFRQSFGSRVRGCEPAMLIYHPAGEVHSQHFGQMGAQLFCVEVTPVRLRELNDEICSLAHPADFNSGLVNVLARKLYFEFSDPDALSQLAIEGLTLELVAASARRSERNHRVPGQPPRWLRQADELVRACTLERFELGDIASAIGVHPVTLAREFRRFYGCSVGEAMRRARIELACCELVKPGAKLCDVALSAGFYDQSHFSRKFKQATGITPAQYRAKHLAANPVP
jgi:AraC-like DNA-binding protein/quercetin dioxygenase-like cupin family protein